ncbi:O-antigen ligase family protein [Methylovirgula sp. 4M-Z18]|nr:O-antigen ligase family protein [Methylovirgula sp. 4M-Z18]
MGGVLAPAIFLGLWLLTAMAHPTQSIAQVVRARLPLTLPLLACASTLWSRDAPYTIKIGSEFLIVMVIAVYIGHRMAPAKLISALTVATVMQMLASLVFNRHEDMFYAGNEALVGVFGSKNFMGYMAALCSLLSLATVAERNQPQLVRLVAAGGLVIGPILALQARSLDALAALAVGFSVALFFIFVATLPSRFRTLVIASVAVMLVATLLAFLLIGAQLGQILELVGKDSSLTGRTILWQRAGDMIHLNPLLGVGYNAFWRQGFVEAEGLWRQLHVDSRTGFHFHNLYYEVRVEMGLVGVLVWGTFMASTVIACLIRVLREPSPSTAFFIGFTLFTLARMWLEVEMMGPFDLAPILFAIGWTYATAPQPMARAGATPPRRPQNMPMLEVATTQDLPRPKTRAL